MIPRTLRSGAQAVTLICLAHATSGCPQAPATTADSEHEGGEPPPAPQVHELSELSPPAAEAYPGLVQHGPPGPLTAGAVTDDWPCFLGPQRNGHARETNLLVDFDGGGPGLLWTMPRGQGYACPAVQGGRLVYPHRVGAEVHVDCLEAETGRRFWRYTYPCDYRGQYIPDNGPRATPVIDGDRVYVHGVEGMLHCFDLPTGRVVWKRDIPAEYGVGDQFFGVVASPLIHDDLLIQNVGAPGGPCVVAFDKHTGRQVWGSGDKWGPGCASPVVATVGGAPRLLVVTGGKSRPPTGGLMILDPDTGTIAFEYPFRSRTFESVNGATPIVGDDRVFITAAYSTGTAAIAANDDGTFRELWKTRHLGMQFSNPIYVDGHLYAIDGRSDRVGEIVCLDPATGEELSRTDVSWDEVLFHRGAESELPQSIGEGSLMYVDGRGLCLGDNGHLLWLDLRPDGVEVLARTSLFRANETWAPPVLSRGLLYVCQNTRERFGREPEGRRLLCFDLRGPGG